MVIYSKEYQNELEEEVKLLEQIKKIYLIKAIKDEEKELGICNCGKKVSVRSYGGESGDYCFECYFEMLKRINGIE